VHLFQVTLIADPDVARLVTSANKAKQQGDLKTQARLLLEASALLMKADRSTEAIGLCLMAGDFGAAARCAETLGDYEQAAKLHFRGGDMVAAAEAHLKSGQDYAAAELLERNRAPERAAAIYARCGDLLRAAIAWEAAGQYLEAANMLVRVLKGEDHHAPVGPEAAEICRRAGVLYERIGEVDRAVAVLRFGGLLQFAAQVLSRAGRRAEALEMSTAAGDFLTAAELARELGDDHRASRLLAERARRSGRMLDAAKDLEKAGDLVEAARYREYAGDRSTAARLYHEAGRPDLAASLTAGEAAPLVAPVLPFSPLAVAQSCFAKARRGDAREYGKVIEIAGGVSRHDPDYVEAQILIAKSLLETRRRDRALAVYEELFEQIKPSEATVSPYYEYGKLLEVEGHLSHARAVYRDVSRIKPHYMDVEERLSILGDSAVFDLEMHQPPRSISSATRLTVRDEAPLAALDASRPASFAGQMLRGRFRLERHLGSGSQAQVFLARDVVLDRPVAIKILDAFVAKNRLEIERFLAEARLLARIHHTSCIAVYDFGQENGVVFMAMEYFPGRTLALEMADGRVDIPRALWIGREVAAALAAVHRAGVIHRDIKPSNIMLDDEDGLRLADFGVATLVSNQSGSGTINGTLMYMAPEQAAGDVKPASDVYSLGVMLHEMIAGEAPFAGTIQSLIDRISKPAPAISYAIDVAEPVREIIRQCLSPVADERPSLAELIDVLGSSALVQSDIRTESNPPPAEERNRT
jgi:tetratricopeptide (TPR) repeat protein